MQPIVPHQLKQCDTTKVPFIDVCVILLCFILSKQTDFMHKTGDYTNQVLLWIYQLWRLASLVIEFSP